MQVIELDDAFGVLVLVLDREPEPGGARGRVDAFGEHVPGAQREQAVGGLPDRGVVRRGERLLVPLAQVGEPDAERAEHRGHPGDQHVPGTGPAGGAADGHRAGPAERGQHGVAGDGGSVGQGGRDRGRVDLLHPAQRVVDRDAQRPGDLVLDHLHAPVRMQGQRPAQVGCWVEHAGQQQHVGDRGLVAAEPEAGRPGCGAHAVRADRQVAVGDPEDRAAAHAVAGDGGQFQ